MLPPVRIDIVVAIARRVNLDVVHARIHESLYLGLDETRNLPQQFRARGVEFVRHSRLETDCRKLAGAWYRHLHRPRRVGLQKLPLIFGEAARLPQLCAHHLPGALLGGFAARPLPHANHRRRVGHYESVHGLDQVVLESRPAKLPVGKDTDAGGPLPLQRVQDGTVFNLPQSVCV